MGEHLARQLGTWAEDVNRRTGVVGDLPRPALGRGWPRVMVLTPDGDRLGHGPHDELVRQEHPRALVHIRGQILAELAELQTAEAQITRRPRR